MLTPTRSETQADMMVGTYPKNYNVGLSVTGNVDVVANTPSRKPIIVVSWLKKLVTSP